MAATRIIPLHQNKGKTILQTLTERTSYAMNPDKTDEGAHISAYECAPETVDSEFLLAKRAYQSITGREPKQGRDVLAYLIRQSFFPGEVTPEEANKVGYELAMRFTHGQHAFIVATHVDKAHVHNHIVFNSTTLDCTHKFNNFKGSADAVREISDQLCMEHQLSVIEDPAPKGKHYAEWKAEKAGTSWKAQLRKKIDEVLPGCVDFEHFIRRMEQAGYAVKRGKYLAFKASEQGRFTRLKTLGEAYTEENLSNKIRGLKTKVFAQNRPKNAQNKVSFLIDIQQKLAEGKGAGYEKWATVFNLKEMAHTLNFYREHNVSSIEEMAERVEAAVNDYDLAREQLKQTEARMREIKELRSHIIDYGRTREVYAQYRQAKNPAKFYEAHEGEIETHKAAKKAFDHFGVGQKLPSVKQLNAEYAELAAIKNAQYETYRQAKKEMYDWQATQSNLKRILKDVEKQKHRGFTR